MTEKKKILVVDDEENLRHMLQVMLKKLGYLVDQAADGADALEKARQGNYAFILCDIRMPVLDGKGFLAGLGEAGIASTVIMMSAYGSVEDAIGCMKLGAYDYISKPFNSDEISLVLKKAEERERLKEENRRLREEVVRGRFLGDIISRNDRMSEIMQLVKKLAGHKTTVLILGESGTGKELIARAIHYNSKRLGKPFIPLNCAAIPKELLESELFGFEKGAFTGATERKLGKFEQANGGTIFLDEIGDMPFDLQAKILRVLQEREITRTGGNQSIAVDVRVVAATNQDLEESVRNKLFREDLYYRLNVIPIQLVPLRDRKDDVPLLVQYFLTKICAELEAPVKRCSADAIKLLTNYSWPGNIRELENTIKRAVILSPDPLLVASDFPGLRSRQGEGKGEELSLEGIVDLKLRGCFSNMEKMESGDVHAMVLEQVERPLIRFVLEKTRGNQVRAADILGINRNTLRKKITELGIELRKE